MIINSPDYIDADLTYVAKSGWETGRVEFFAKLDRCIRVIPNSEFRVQPFVNKSGYSPGYAKVSWVNGINRDTGKTFYGVTGVDIVIDGDYYEWNEQFLDCVKTHEKWELYFRTKPGFNTFKKDGEMDKRRNAMQTDPFFAHKLARRKELERAQELGILEEYMNFEMRKHIEEAQHMSILGSQRRKMQFIDSYVRTYRRITGKSFILPRDFIIAESIQKVKRHLSLRR